MGVKLTLPLLRNRKTRHFICKVSGLKEANLFLSACFCLTDPSYTVLTRLNACYFFVKQLESIKRITNLVGTQNCPHY